MLNSIKTILLSICVFCLTSCSSSNNLISKDVYLANPDKFNPNTKIYYGSSISIIPYSIGGGFLMAELNLRFEQVKSYETWLINTDYGGKEWMFVNKIKFIVNNDFYDFDSIQNPIREVRTLLGDSYCSETNYFIITPKFCSLVLSANKMSVRLIGQNSYKDYDFSKEEIQKLKNFITYIATNVANKNKLKSH
jgi:hypothetical protein